VYYAVRQSIVGGSTLRPLRPLLAAAVEASSHQRVVTCLPGFVWNGAVASEGMLPPAILELFKLVKLRDRGEVACGELISLQAQRPDRLGVRPGA
jgi:hypothetical protein